MCQEIQELLEAKLQMSRLENQHKRALCMAGLNYLLKDGMSADSRIRDFR